MEVLNRLLAFVLVTMVMGAAPRASSAQGPVIEVTADDGWKCHPATTNGTVVGFLFEQVAGSVASNGFNVVWYERAGDEFAMTIGWKDTAVLQAAVKVATTHGQADLFSNAAIGPDVLESIRSCHLVAADGVAVQSGLAVDDPLQPIAAQLLPDVMEFVVEIGAAGATALSAKEVEIVQGQGGQTTVASKELLGLALRVESDIAGGNGMTMAFSRWFCWPGTYCRSTSVTGPCNLVGGFGSGSCSGCKYRCTVTTFETCAYISLDCTVGPATTTTTTTAKNKSCRGDPTNCPPTPRPGC